VLVGALPVTVVVDCAVVVTVLVVVVVVVQDCMVEEAGLVVVFRVEGACFVLVVMELPAALHCPPTTPAAQGLHWGAGLTVVIWLHPGKAARGPSRSSGNLLVVVHWAQFVLESKVTPEQSPTSCDAQALEPVRRLGRTPSCQPLNCTLVRICLTRDQWWTYEVGMEAVTGRISVGKHKRVDLKLSLEAWQVVVVLHEDMRKLDRMCVRASSISDVANRIGNVRVGRVDVEVFAIPAVRELDGTVEVGVLWAGCDTLREATLSSLVPRRRFVADPLSDVVHGSRSVFLCGTDVSVSSSHAEALGELEGLAHLASAGIDVVDLMTIGLGRLWVMCLS
jgi:hypothetical protein